MLQGSTGAGAPHGSQEAWDGGGAQGVLQVLQGLQGLQGLQEGAAQGL